MFPLFLTPFNVFWLLAFFLFADAGFHLCVLILFFIFLSTSLSSQQSVRTRQRFNP